MTIRLVGYLRTSGLDQLTAGFGADAQRADVEKWATAYDAVIVGWQIDAGVSGTTDLDERDGLMAALASVQDREADGVVAARLDRIARALHVQEAILATVWAAGGVVATADAGVVLADDPDDPMRTAVRQIMGAMAQLDRAMIVKRLRDGKRQATKAGAWAGGGALPWEARVETAQVRGRGRAVLAPDPAKADAVAVVVTGHEDGRTLLDIAGELESRGFKPARAARWSAEGVRQILARNHRGDCPRCVLRDR